MLKYADAAVKRPVAKPRPEPIDIETGFERAMTRFPTIIAHLAK